MVTWDLEEPVFCVCVGYRKVYNHSEYKKLVGKLIVVDLAQKVIQIVRNL